MQTSDTTMRADQNNLPQRHLVVVQCRYNSTRLPGKAMMLLGGLPILSFLLKRLKVGLPEDRFKIILATTENRADNVIANLGEEEEVEVLRGDEHDVLKRYLRCLEIFPADIVVRVTADNPLTCPNVIQCAVKEMIERKVDYLKCENLPVGSGVDVFSSKILKRLGVEAKDLQEREHINMYILKHKEKFATYFMFFDGKYAQPSIRITVDTIEDLDNVRSIFKKSDLDTWRMSLLEIVERMDSSII